MTPVISVCIVTHDRHGLLAACLQSLRRQHRAPTHEILVGIADDPVAAEVVRRQTPAATVIDVPRTTPGAARNLLVTRARGDVVLFLDDDVTVPPELLHRLAVLADRHQHIGVYGGANLTPAGSCAVERSQGEALAALLGAGPLRHRFRVRPPGRADERHLMLCNLAIRRRLLRPFPNDLRTAEENALLAQLEGDGVLMHSDPLLTVRHRRRESHQAFARQVHGWGIGRGQLTRRRLGTVRPWHLAPAALVVYLALLPALLAAAGPGAAAAAVTYLGVALGWAVQRPRRSGARLVCLLLLHLGYGLGVLRGLTLPTGHAPPGLDVAPAVRGPDPPALSTARP